jgi:hypothetical protein
LKKDNFRRKDKKGYLSIIFFIVAIIFSVRMYAQPEAQRPARILFLVDASSSMLTDWTSSETRFNTASRVISTIVDSIHKVNTDVAFAVRVFGNQYPAQDKNCYDTRLEVPFNLGNDAQIKARLKYLKPLGYSPIAWSLKETAEKDFIESDQYAYSIILITDGGESCGGDICATVKNLLEKKISFKPYILSLVDYEPLRLQYECLGRYLTVAKEKDIEPAIRTIINDNRKILTIKTPTLKPIPQKVTQPAATPIITKPVTPPVVKQEPVIVKQDPVPTKPVIKEEPPKPVVIEEPPIVLKKLTPLDRIISLTRPRKMNLLYTLADGNPVRVPRLTNIRIVKDDEPQQTVVSPPVPPVNTPKPAVPKNKPGIIEPVTGSTTPKPAPAKNPIRKTETKTEEKLDFVVKVEEAKESTLQVYFTNGQGRFYKTEPRMLIKDSKTGKEIKNIYRNVTGGEPDPIKLEPGTYDIVIPGGRSKASGIVIEPGKNKKYYIKVNNSSLAFYYPTSPDRPVKEFTALVSKRFEPGPVVKQKCDTELPYEPENYHIEINTLPVMILNVDLEFNNVKLISIPETGSVQITNQNAVGKVQFWHQLGDTYVPFYEMAVQGNPATQKVDFLPGLYQVRFYTGPVTPLAKAELIMFRVKSNMTTSIELQK